MTRYKPRDSNPVYQVMRQIVLHPDDAYSSKIAEKTDKSQGQVSDIIKSLKEENLVRKGERTKAQLYEPDYQALENLFTELWNIDKTYPDFQDFLEKYVHTYMNEKEKSTLEAMLRKDLLTGIVTYIDNFEDEMQEEEQKFFKKIISGEPIPSSPESIVEMAFHRHRGTH